MAISKLKIQNFKSYKGIFTLYLDQGLNILVGDNESGKSTILEAIHVALTGYYHGRNIRTELSQYLFNKEAVSEYIASVQQGNAIAPPTILIEIFFDAPIDAELFEGNENTDKETQVEGLQFKIAYDDKYNDEYQKIINRVIIYPTTPMKEWIFNHNKELKPKSRARLYVAVTRAKYSVAIILADCKNVDGISVWKC